MEVIPLASTACALPFSSSSSTQSSSSRKKRGDQRIISHHSRGAGFNVSVNTNSVRIRLSSSTSHYKSPTLVSHHGLRKSDDLGGRHLSTSERFNYLASRQIAYKSMTKSRVSRPTIVVAVFERFTERAIKSVMLAQKEAKAFDKQEVGTEELLLGLIAEDRASEGFLRSGVTIERAREAARSLSTQNAIPGNISPSQMPFSSSTKRVFEAALQSSKTMGHNYIAPEHITIAILTVDVDGMAWKLLECMGVNREKLRSEAISRLQGELANEGRTPIPPTAVPEKSSAGAGTVSKRSRSKKEKESLEDFCVDLTARARDGKIDPVIGRDKEVQRVVEILGRRTKNNPMLLGEPGVGKTAIAEGLALRIVNSGVPEFLSEKRVMSLDMGLLLAGAKERGELESRVTNLIDEIKQSGNVILLIDEVHTLVGSGSAGRGGSGGGGLDIANLLKPPLARGELQCIGATTIVEHRKHIEKDKALARRFQPVMVDEPSQEDALEILMGLREKYEEHHKCRITAEALEAAVYLSARYIPDRFLPDKAIDLLDEAGSRARINAFKTRKERQVAILSSSPSEYWKEIRMAQAFHESMLVPQTSGIPVKSNEEDDTISGFLETESDAQDSSSLGVHTMLESDDYDDGLVVVGPEEIASIASMWSGIPVEQLTADEQKKLIHLEETLQTRVVGQRDAVSAIARAIKRARVGLKDPNRPIATMLFCGPTGVGKTELTKALSEHYFGSESAMVRLDMSEYMERHTVSKLIGSPPGYVGYGDGGTLTEAVRRQPFTVILLDEIEKAHPDVFNLLLQIFEDGHLTDSQGRKVSFKNTLLIMTSNIGSTAIAKGGSNRIGFTFTDHSNEGKYAVLRSLVMEELKSYFRPELLNRLDDVVVFRSLEKSDVREIVEMMLKETKARLSEMGIGLEISEAMVQLVCDQGYDRTYGARPLRRAIVQLVEDKVSEALLAEAYNNGDTALVDIDETGNPVVMHHLKPDRSCEEVCVSIRTGSL